MEKNSYSHLFIYEGMLNFILLAFLIGHDKRLAAVIVHVNRTGFRFVEPLGIDLGKIDKGYHEAVCNEWSKFFHKIQGKSGSAGTIAMQKTDFWVEANPLQG